MTTETDASGQTPITVTAILAKLILLRHNKSLPEPTTMRAVVVRESNRMADIELCSLPDLHTWVKAFGGKRANIETLDYSHISETKHSISFHHIDDTGWWYQLHTTVSRGETAPSLDAETVAALEAVA